MITSKSIRLMHKFYLFRVSFNKIFKTITISNFKDKKTNQGLRLKFLLTKIEIMTNGL